VNDDPHTDEPRTARGSSDEVSAGDAAESTEPAGDESGLGRVALLIAVVGIGLFIFPEPTTSMAGAVLAAIGVLAWLVDRFA